jgi:multiple sugar transport system permease protein
MVSLAPGPAGPIPSNESRTSAAAETRAGWLSISPWLVGFLIFTLGPLLASLYFSFTKYDVLTPPQWIGLENYAKKNV